MLMNRFIHVITWAPNFLYLLGLVLQIRMNFRLGTCKGLSDLLLLSYLNGYWAFWTYAQIYNLPYAYKVSIPFSAFAVLLIFAQRFMYDGFFEGTMRRAFMLNVAALLVVSCLIPYYPLTIGFFAGWMNVLIWTVYQIPQVIHIFRKRSTQGFCFALAAMYALGESCELIAALSLGFPIQTIVGDIRGFFLFGVFAFQFWLYAELDEAVVDDSEVENEKESGRCLVNS